jgi:hypothetical protein
MDYNRNADFFSVFDGVFSPALAIRRNEGVENVRVFGNQTVAGIKCLSENVTG